MVHSPRRPGSRAALKALLARFEAVYGRTATPVCASPSESLERSAAPLPCAIEAQFNAWAAARRFVVVSV